MDSAVLLFALRLISALFLLGFLVALAWIVLQDLRSESTSLVELRRAQGHLRVIASDVRSAAAGTIFPLLPVTRIGRAESNTIVLDDAFISAEHALLSRRDSQWWVEDLNSRNGTLLNDLMLTEATVVSNGDVISVGSVQLKIEANEISG